MWAFLQQSSLDGVWFWDLENVDNEWMSPEFWRLFGVDPDTKRHDPAEWQDIINRDDLKVALENFHKHCADPDHPYDQVVRYRHADGSTVWVRCRGLAIRDAAGKPVRLLGAHNDLTAVKRAEQRARAEKRAADVANEELKTFAYSISHDLKAPSNTLDLLLSEIESVHGADLPDEVSHLLDLSHQTVHRMQSLIEDVLDYTRVVGETITLEPVSLDDLVASVVEDQRGAMSDTGAEVDIQRLPAVLGHRTHIRILFQNLISNALKYQQPGARPRIAIAETTRPRDTLCAITVTDNGIGIPANQQERIFNMFQRLYGDETYTGTGLGLAICKRIAVSHGGEISVDSRMGEGSAFTVTLQRA